MRKQITLILPLVAAIVSIAGIHGFWWLESAVAQNASMAGNMTTATNTTMTGNMTATSGGSAKTHLEDGIKALESGNKEGAMTQLTTAQQAMSGSSPEAIKHFEEGMKALESGDSNGAIMHLKFADQSLG
jgi:hypothetical protein